MRRAAVVGELRSVALGALGLLALLAVMVGAPTSSAEPRPSRLDALASAAPGLDPEVLDLALRATSCAARRGLVANADRLTVIDYTKPSTEPRLWVLDLARPALLFEELVAHGRGSGEERATRFSNEPGSLATSLGLFVTLDTYTGRHGRSLRLRGLEPGINDRAYERAIVIHGASYVTRAFALLHGRLGRSWGCPALALDVAQRVIDTIRGGAPVFAYADDPAWLRASPFLTRCDDARAAAVETDRLR